MLRFRIVSPRRQVQSSWIAPSNTAPRCSARDSTASPSRFRWRSSGCRAGSAVVQLWSAGVTLGRLPGQIPEGTAAQSGPVGRESRAVVLLLGLGVLRSLPPLRRSLVLMSSSRARGSFVQTVRSRDRSTTSVIWSSSSERLSPASGDAVGASSSRRDRSSRIAAVAAQTSRDRSARSTSRAARR